MPLLALASQIFRMMDKNKDARLSYDEFAEGSKKDPTIVQVRRFVLPLAAACRIVGLHPIVLAQLADCSHSPLVISPGSLALRWTRIEWTPPLRLGPPGSSRAPAFPSSSRPLSQALSLPLCILQPRSEALLSPSSICTPLRGSPLVSRALPNAPVFPLLLLALVSPSLLLLVCYTCPNEQTRPLPAGRKEPVTTSGSHSGLVGGKALWPADILPHTPVQPAVFFSRAPSLLLIYLLTTITPPTSQASDTSPTTTVSLTHPPTFHYVRVYVIPFDDPAGSGPT